MPSGTYGLIILKDDINKRLQEVGVGLTQKSISKAKREKICSKHFNELISIELLDDVPNFIKAQQKTKELYKKLYNECKNTSHQINQHIYNVEMKGCEKRIQFNESQIKEYKHMLTQP